MFAPTLEGYARFVELVRMYNDDGQMSLADAVGAAIDQCIEIALARPVERGAITPEQAAEQRREFPGASK